MIDLNFRDKDTSENISLDEYVENMKARLDRFKVFWEKNRKECLNISGIGQADEQWPEKQWWGNWSESLEFFPDKE